MKLYNVILNEDAHFNVKEHLTIELKVEKSYSAPGYWEKPENERNALNEWWKSIAMEEALEKYPNNIRIHESDRMQVITQSQYEQIFKYCQLKSIISVNEEIQFENIDLDLLAAKIATSLIGKTGSNLFNNRLEVHQPNMPLFTYNDYIYELDCCSERLQEHIDDGYRVVAICPQPDQRRPDYVLGRYIAK